jgi:hypothetical protein
MKQIVNNLYVKEYSFTSFQEFKQFFDNVECEKKIFFDDTLGDDYYCYKFCDSLGGETKFIIGFNTDSTSEWLNILFWNSKKLLVIETGSHIKTLDENLNTVFSQSVFSRVNGLYVSGKDNLLVMEEIGIVLIDSNGNILEDIRYELVKDYRVENDVLFMELYDEQKFIVDL